MGRDWEQKHQVMGKTVKSNPHRPRALLSVYRTSQGLGNTSHGKCEQSEEIGISGVYSMKASLAATQDDLPDDEDEDEIFVGGGLGSAAKTPFSNRAWGARRAIEDAKMALLEIDEQRRLLGRSELSDKMREATLRTVAIKYRMLQAALGFSTQNTNSSVDCIDNGSTVSTTLSDPKRLADIVTMEKGKKMVALVMTARLPSQAKAMLPTTLRVVLSKPPIRREDIDKEPLGSNRFVLESAAIADDIIMSAAFSVVSSTAYPFAYTAAKACIENVMM